MTVFAVEYRYDESSAAHRDEVRPSHRAWVDGVADEGRILASGPYEDGTGALILFKVEDATTLEGLLEQDPFAVAGLISSTRATAWNPVSGPLAEQF